MHLSDEQVSKIRDWARSTPKVRELRLFGSYAKGSAHEDSDIDLAVGANAGNWTALADTWERQLSEKLGLEVHRTLLNPAISEACEECSTLWPELGG